MALFGELSLEGAMNLSRDRLLLEPLSGNSPVAPHSFSVICFLFISNIAIEFRCRVVRH
jgi:hypothetical protein